MSTTSLTHENGAEVLDAEPKPEARLVMPDGSRDYFAGEALNAIIAKNGPPPAGGEEDLAKQCFRIAGAMMDQRAIIEAEENATASLVTSKAQTAARPNVAVAPAGVRR